VLEGLRAHTIVHLKFVTRSRVLIGFALLLLLMASVMLLPAMFIGTAANRFDLLKRVADELHAIAGIITAGLGLFVLWSHRRTRSIKLVATRPGSFDAWVASLFVVPAVFGVVAHSAVVAITFALSLYWDVPYQVGFVYVAVQWLAQSVIVLAYLTALGVVAHPVLAVLTLLFFNASTFQMLGVTLGGAIEAGYTSALWRAAGAAVATLYYIAPTFSPLADQTSVVNETLRVAAIDWRYLGEIVAYALLTSAFGFMTTLVLLRRRQLT
jgi:hypothetical protein